MKRNNLRLYGVVQGVGCRYFITRIASSMGIVGYVKNMPDGSVEVCAEGEDSTLDSFVEAIKEGPAAGTIDRINVKEETPTGEYSSFSIEF